MPDLFFLARCLSVLCTFVGKNAMDTRDFHTHAQLYVLRHIHWQLNQDRWLITVIPEYERQAVILLSQIPIEWVCVQNMLVGVNMAICLCDCLLVCFTVFLSVTDVTLACRETWERRREPRRCLIRLRGTVRESSMSLQPSEETKPRGRYCSCAWGWVLQDSSPFLSSALEFLTHIKTYSCHD